MLNFEQMSAIFFSKDRIIDYLFSYMYNEFIVLRR